MVWSDLWSQFAALAGTLLLVGALAKTRPGRALIKNNVTDPYRDWLKGIHAPMEQSLGEMNTKLYELADYMDYEFSANGGSSLRDRVNAGVAAAGGPEDPRAAGDEHSESERESPDLLH